MKKQQASNTAYKVKIHGHQYSSPTLEFCSRIVQTVRDNCSDNYGWGSRRFGSEFPVTDASGKVVATVSYNGRIWEPLAEGQSMYSQRTMICEAVA
jgi:hypothetical protein